MGEWLLKFGIGGVQEFIGQSRKVRDLANSSKLVSELARAAAVAGNNIGKRLLFPRAGGPAHPHQMILELSGTESDVRCAGQQMIEAARDVLKRLVTEDSLNKLIEGMDANTDFSVLASQLESVFEFYWVAVAKSGSFMEAFQQLQETYERRRHTRTFQQLIPLQTLPSRACSVCGQRAAIIQPPKNGWPDRARFVTKKEHLCAVCASKRAWGWGKKAPISTYGLVKDRFIRDSRFEAVRSTPISGKTLSYKDWLDLFDRMSEIEDSAKVQSPDKCPGGELNNAYESLTRDDAAYKAFKNLSAYYAIIQYDGDRMGEWISGQHFRDGIKKDDNDFKKAQGALSESLTAFAESVNELSQGFRALLVYAGGDDGLILCPVDLCLDLVEQIHARWDSHVSNAAHPNATDGKAPTLSLHISVVHAKEPLQPALCVARESLKTTKDYLDGSRNRFSVRVAPHSGTDALLIAGWGELPSLRASIGCFSNWQAGDMTRPDKARMDERRETRLPTQLGHALIEAAEKSLPEGRERLTNAMREALDLEFGRLCKKREQATSEQAVAGNDTLRTWIMPPLNCDVGEKARAHVIQRLAVTLFLARQFNWGNE